LLTIRAHSHAVTGCLKWCRWYHRDALAILQPRPLRATLGA
jgi:hypothetical protein